LNNVGERGHPCTVPLAHGINGVSPPINEIFELLFVQIFLTNSVTVVGMPLAVMFDRIKS
jgi:hypothetical protein